MTAAEKSLTVAFDITDLALMDDDGVNQVVFSRNVDDAFAAVAMSG